MDLQSKQDVFKVTTLRHNVCYSGSYMCEDSHVAPLIRVSPPGGSFALGVVAASLQTGPLQENLGLLMPRTQGKIIREHQEHAVDV